MATEYARLGEWRYDDANSEALAPAMLCSVSFFAADLLFLFFDFSITGTPQTMHPPTPPTPLSPHTPVCARAPLPPSSRTRLNLRVRREIASLPSAFRRNAGVGRVG